jgi:hypothetical protein
MPSGSQGRLRLGDAGVHRRNLTFTPPTTHRAPPPPRRSDADQRLAGAPTPGGVEGHRTGRARVRRAIAVRTDSFVDSEALISNTPLPSGLRAGQASRGGGEEITTAFA